MKAMCQARRTSSSSFILHPSSFILPRCSLTSTFFSPRAVSKPRSCRCTRTSTPPFAGSAAGRRSRAGMRKEAWEIDAIRSVGERTEQVVDGVRQMLRDGSAKTLGDLKGFVSREIYRLGMIEDHETILSQGRDAGVPHSRGDAQAAIR